MSPLPPTDRCEPESSPEYFDSRPSDESVTIESVIRPNPSPHVIPIANTIAIDPPESFDSLPSDDPGESNQIVPAEIPPQIGLPGNVCKFPFRDVEQDPPGKEVHKKVVGSSIPAAKKKTAAIKKSTPRSQIKKEQVTKIFHPNQSQMIREL